MDIKLTIEAPDLASAINRLAESLENQSIPTSVSSTEESAKPEPTTKTKKEDKPKKSSSKNKKEDKPKSQYSLDTVTTKTREFIQADKENRQLLKSFLDEKGVSKVSELPEEHYDEYMKFVEENLS
ncbi:hypothetical protein ACTWQB_11435 [Piscibacillus sp. B03]|uniref:hypothetical protein n=1 Tax=Piscibacillus sp. B03 TaxID=3457430 RepID=UPI003FCD178A